MTDRNFDPLRDPAELWDRPETTQSFSDTEEKQ